MDRENEGDGMGMMEEEWEARWIEMKRGMGGDRDRM